MVNAFDRPRSFEDIVESHASLPQSSAKAAIQRFIRTAIRHNPPIRSKAARLRAKGKAELCIVGAVCFRSLWDFRFQGTVTLSILHGCVYSYGIPPLGFVLIEAAGVWRSDDYLSMNPNRNDICKLFLVEDSDEEVLLFHQVVKRMAAGFDIVGRAASGGEAIEYLKGVGRYRDRGRYPWPDVIVLEIRLTTRTGFEVLEWMKARKNMPEVVIFSRSEAAQEKQRALALGAALYQHKAYEIEVIERFLHWVKRLWEVEQLKRERARLTL